MCSFTILTYTVLSKLVHMSSRADSNSLVKSCWNGQKHTGYPSELVEPICTWCLYLTRYQEHEHIPMFILPWWNSRLLVWHQTQPYHLLHAFIWMSYLISTPSHSPSPYTLVKLANYIKFIVGASFSSSIFAIKIEEP